ncbi:MAG: cyclophane-forming radical SAM/SPASM peptide maturase GrrM/OscB [Synechococcus sp.]
MSPKNPAKEVEPSPANGRIPELEVEEYGSIDLVIIQATSFCNLDCDYCYLPDRTVKNVFNLDLIEPIFKEIFTSRFLGPEVSICWHAGEPLAVPRSFYQTAFAAIARVEQEYNLRNCLVRQSVQTNGTLINQAWCELFLKHNVEVGLSLDGPAFLHDAHRKNRKGLGTHTSVMRGVNFLNENGIDFFVICVLTQDSLDYPEEIFEFFVENGITDVGFNIEELEGVHKSSSLATRQTEEKFRAFIGRFWDLVAESRGRLSLREFERIATILHGSGEKLRSGLTRPFEMINFDTNGNFTTFDPELLGVDVEPYGKFVFGNILKDSLESICQTAKFRQVYADIQAGVAQCRESCQYFRVCGGGSACNKYWENGTFRSTETMACRLYEQIVTDVVLEKFEESMGLR